MCRRVSLPFTLVVPLADYFFTSHHHCPYRDFAAGRTPGCQANGMFHPERVHFPGLISTHKKNAPSCCLIFCMAASKGCFSRILYHFSLRFTKI
jgi:hypothetical protein